MRTLFSRIVAPLVVALAGWLAAAGLDLGPEFVESLTLAATILLMGGFTALSGVVHKLLDRKWNPSDVAAERSHEWPL